MGGLPETVSFSEMDSSSGNMQRRAKFFSPGAKKVMKVIYLLSGKTDKKQNLNTLKENCKLFSQFF